MITAGFVFRAWLKLTTIDEYCWLILLKWRRALRKFQSRLSTVVKFTFMSRCHFGAEEDLITYSLLIYTR